MRQKPSEYGTCRCFQNEVAFFNNHMTGVPQSSTVHTDFGVNETLGYIPHLIWHLKDRLIPATPQILTKVLGYYRRFSRVQTTEASRRRWPALLN